MSTSIWLHSYPRVTSRGLSRTLARPAPPLRAAGSAAYALPARACRPQYRRFSALTPRKTKRRGFMDNPHSAIDNRMEKALKAYGKAFSTRLPTLFPPSCQQLHKRTGYPQSHPFGCALCYLSFSFYTKNRLGSCPAKANRRGAKAGKAESLAAHKQRLCFLSPGRSAKSWRPGLEPGAKLPAVPLLRRGSPTICLWQY